MRERADGNILGGENTLISPSPTQPRLSALRNSTVAANDEADAGKDISSIKVALKPRDWAPR
jgi:hypothetical protein